MNRSQPILDLFAPTGVSTAPPGEPIRGAFDGLPPRRAAFAASRLLFLFGPALPGVELEQASHGPDEDVLPLSGPGAAAYVGLTFMRRLPLASGPQDISGAIQNCSIIRGWPARLALLRSSGQRLSDLTLQQSRGVRVIGIFRLFGRVFAHVASRLDGLVALPILRRMRAFSPPFRFTDGY